MTDEATRQTATRIDPQELPVLNLIRGKHEHMMLAMSWPNVTRREEPQPGDDQVPPTGGQVPTWYSVMEWSEASGVPNVVAIRVAAGLLFRNHLITADGGIRRSLQIYSQVQVALSMQRGAPRRPNGKKGKP